MFRWIQLSITDFEELCRKNPNFKNELNSPGYRCSPDDGELNTHIEFHVGDHEVFRDMMEIENVGCADHST
jgi:hypothetical protein